MQAEHLCKWLGETKWEEAPDANHWQNVVSIVQEVLRNGILVDDSMWQMVVLVPKGGGGEFWGIGLLEVLCKTVTGLLNRHFTSAICFHDVLHGFQAGRGTSTVTLKANLIQQFTAIRSDFLHELFM